MAHILKFPKTPEFDWLIAIEKRIAEVDLPDIERLHSTVKYLIWSRRCQLAHHQSLEYKVAFGIMLQHHRIMLGMEVMDHEQALIDEAKALLKISNDAIKKRKKAKSG